MQYALLFEESISLARGGGPDLTWLMTTSAVLILLIGGVAYGFRRLVLGGLKGRALQRDLKVLDMLPLGGKRQLAVVRVYDRTFALGLGEKSVEVVAELDTAVVEHDRQKGKRAAATGAGVGAEARLGFEARLQAAKERLLGTHDLTPQAAPGSRPAVSTASVSTASVPAASVSTASVSTAPAPAAPAQAPPVTAPPLIPRRVEPTSANSTTEYVA